MSGARGTTWRDVNTNANDCQLGPPRAKFFAPPIGQVQIANPGQRLEFAQIPGIRDSCPHVGGHRLFNRRIELWAAHRLARGPLGRWPCRAAHRRGDGRHLRLGCRHCGTGLDADARSNDPSDRAGPGCSMALGRGPGLRIGAAAPGESKRLAAGRSAPAGGLGVIHVAIGEQLSRRELPVDLCGDACLDRADARGLCLSQDGGRQAWSVAAFCLRPRSSVRIRRAAACITRYRGSASSARQRAGVRRSVRTSASRDRGSQQS